MQTAEKPQTVMHWEVCTDAKGFLFDPTGISTMTRRQAVTEMRALHKRLPGDYYLVKVVRTRVSEAEE